MAFQIRNTKDDSIIYSNDHREKDFIVTELNEIHKTIQYPQALLNTDEWFFDGIRMAHNHWQFEELNEMEWTGDLDMIHMHFTLNGRFLMQMASNDKLYRLDTRQHNIFYSGGGQGLLKNEGKAYSCFIVQIHRDVFLRLTQGANDVLWQFGDTVMENKISALASDCLYMDLNMMHIIHSIMNCPYDKSLKKMFLFSKCIELLVLQAEAYQKSFRSEKRYVKTPYDTERLQYAHDYLLDNLDNPPSLSELSRIIGLNEYKLKRGFKELFNNTVFGFISNNRLEHAKKMLLDTQKTAGEIAFELGYSSLAHFSAAYKKKFGISPKGKS